IRDFHVTGVQTCALPIFIAASLLFSSCEEVIDLDLDQHEKRVVIDANLFVGETSYNKITLSYSSPFYTEGYQYISTASVQITNRSEERRVGKECRSGWSA